MSTIPDLASKCIRCGFCLESCPTFLETGQEAESPRGRIYLIKSADAQQIEWEQTRAHLDTCLGCRGCESACPSGVEYGKLLELARQELGPNSSQRLATELATRPTMMRLQLAFAKLFGIQSMPRWLARRLSDAPSLTSLPKVDHVRAPGKIVEPKAGSVPVAFLEGCAMRVLFPNVHRASGALLTLTGHDVAKTDLGCCGALHAHAGMLEEGHQRAETVRRRAAGKPVVTNSAGCGSWLKECNVPTLDLSEAISKLDLSRAHWDGAVTYHDACHLAHGQGIRSIPRDLIQAVPGVHFVELNEADLCCGSAGTYNLTQPTMANQLLERKWKNIQATGAKTVVLGNPGCHSWIAQAAKDNVRVMHLAEFLAEALGV